MVVLLKEHLVVLYIFLGIIVNSETSKTTSTQKTIVVFDPYVSILDKYNRFRYNQTDLLPLIQTISGKFQHLCVQLSQYDLDEDFKTSPSLIPEAVADFNKKNDRKMKVWLYYTASTAYYYHEGNVVSYHKHPLLFFNRLNSLAKRSNQLFNDTVISILLHHNLLSSMVKVLRRDNITLKHSFPNVQKWGFVMEDDSLMTEARIFEDYELLRPEYLFYVLHATTNAYKFPIRIKQFTPYGQQFAKRSLVGAVLTIPDTDLRGTSKLSDSVVLWNIATKYSGNIIISKAFDTPYEDSIDQKTSGWWSLIEDHNYNSTSDYKFVEKSALINQVTHHSNTDKLRQLPEKLNISKDHVGVIFSFYDIERAKVRIEPPEMDELVDKVAAMFRKVAVVVHDTSREGREVFRCELKNLIRTKHKFEITLLFLPGAHPSQIMKRMDERMDSNISFNLPLTNIFLQTYLDSIKTYVMPYVGHNTDKEANYLRNILKNADISAYTLGYSFNISLCTSFDRFNESDKKLFDDYMSASDVNTIVIYFEVSDETTKLGPKRMLKQTVALFLQCKNFLAKRIDLSNVTLSFMMLHYGSNSKFYDRKSAVINFVEYWQKLSDWAKSENTTVILNSVLDVERRVITKDLPLREIGWWRYQDVDSRLRMPTQSGGSNAFIDKIEYAKWRFSKHATVFMPTRLVILAFILPVILVVIVAIGVVVWIRANRNKVLTKTEIYEFFNGRQHDSPSKGENTLEDIQCVPYDKDKYELVTKRFSIYEHLTLGSGQYGKVCKGKKFGMDTGTEHVAVKMVNPKDVQRVAVIGLLSEIKVLSYVGRHENIIEMLGANTQNVEIGKVYIFLELCELGSLDKYLKEIRPRPPAGENSEIKYDQLSLVEVPNSDENQTCPSYAAVETAKTRNADAQLAKIPTFDEIQTDLPYVDVETAMTRQDDNLALAETPTLNKNQTCPSYAPVETARTIAGISDDKAEGTEVDETELVNNSLDPLLRGYMYRWSREICSGMAYLASKRVVHADIATRNVLLTLDKTAKICDFGLSRRLYNYTNYKNKSNKPMPWKYISPESLRLQEFNEKSDVWAYGVTLWEIYTLGDEPYYGIWDLDTNFVDRLDDGLRLPKPKYNDENNMFQLMQRCWNANPQNRPAFSEILKGLRYMKFPQRQRI